MKQFCALLSFSFSILVLNAQSLEHLKFGTDSTFEVATWNIERFPKNGETTLVFVKDVIEAMQIDLLAIQEVSDTAAFRRLEQNIKSYKGHFESAYFGGLAYLYDSREIEINSIYEIFSTSQFWNAFPRSPMVMDLNFNNERIIVINNHFKCCGDGTLDIEDEGDEETRRLFAMNYLKEYVDANFANEKVIILGDLNDELTDVNEHNVFKKILGDSLNYSFADFDISNGSSSDWSFPSWPSDLDHIIISNELFSDFERNGSAVKTILVDENLNGWQHYDQHISDHRPVAIKLAFDNTNNIRAKTRKNETVELYPNPNLGYFNISYSKKLKSGVLSIYNLQGAMLVSLPIQNDKNEKLKVSINLANGIYLAQIKDGDVVIGTTKLVISR
ncbi:MAG: T9SS type A sorting domain-containing protein [Bacteroidia bacterium]